MTHGHAHRHYHADMLSVEEARERILANFSVLEPEERPLLECLGQVLAEDARCDINIPPADNSAMDGYAVQFDSIKGAEDGTPVTLKVVGYVAAGQVPEGAVTPGTAFRIMTGAATPIGADTVIPFEDTDEMQRKADGLTLDEIAIQYEHPKGTNVRPTGDDFSKGDLAVERGTVLRPAELGVLAAIGKPTVKVYRRPVIAVLATGDELQEPGEPPQPGKIYNTNNYSIAASVTRYGGIVKLLGIARDNLEDLEAKVEEALSCDLLLTSAGVSKGDYDIVKDVLGRKGKVELWSVRMRPAKPLAFGLLDGPDGRKVPHLGLPGNPVSALVAFEQVARPAILKMLGKTRLDKPSITAILEDDITNSDSRRVYARVIVTKREGTYYAKLAGGQGSHVLSAVARGNGLAVCPEEQAAVRAGEEVKVEMLDWPEEYE
ncbi:MAG: molybdopterin molybdotransferase [Chloroflexi bacterium]|jgi:molybdopterin molybdotransferase|nr:MAG: molybdopterin molybdotransferase [Chloroflexota bacterium]